jgi:hypothetical protein
MTIDQFVQPLPQKSLDAALCFYLDREIICGRTLLRVVGIKHTQVMRPNNKIEHTLVFLVELLQNNTIPSEMKKGLEKQLRTYFGLDTHVRLIKTSLSNEYHAVEKKRETLVYALWCGEKIVRFCIEHNIEFDMFHVLHYRIKYKDRVVDIHPHTRKWVDMKKSINGELGDISLFLQQFLSS